MDNRKCSSLLLLFLASTWSC